ncbi:HlyD family secretion protein [Roseomonas sp. GCM10028921]
MNARTPAIPETETRASGPAKPRPSRIRRVLLLAALLVLAGGSVGGGWCWTVGRFMESTDNAYVGGDIAVLSSRIEGDVERILVADNQAVEAGQPLIELDRRDWQARRDAVAAALAEAERVRAVADAGRAGTLASGGYGTREAVDRTLAARRKAEAAVTAAQAGLEAARGALSVLEAQSRSAVARRDSARASLALAESNLEHTIIRAPFAGIAGNRAAQIGQHVRAGQNLIAVSSTADRLYVTANFKETQLRRTREG